MNISTVPPSPSSPTRSPAEGFLWWRSLLFAVALAAVSIVLPSLLVVVALVTRVASRSAILTPGPALGLQILSYVFVGLLFAASFTRLAQQSWAQIGLRPLTGRELAWAVGGAFAMILVTDVLGTIEEALLHQKITESAIDLLKATHGAALTTLFVAFACAIGPFFEELQFRGFVYAALRRYLGVPLAAVGSGLIFGAAHASALALIPLAGGGIVLALVYERTRSLVASTIAHGLFNTVSVVALLVFHQTS